MLICQCFHFSWPILLILPIVGAVHLLSARTISPNANTFIISGAALQIIGLIPIAFALNTVLKEVTQRSIWQRFKEWIYLAWYVLRPNAAPTILATVGTATAAASARGVGVVSRSPIDRSIEGLAKAIEECRQDMDGRITELSANLFAIKDEYRKAVHAEEVSRKRELAEMDTKFTKVIVNEPRYAIASLVYIALGVAFSTKPEWWAGIWFWS